MGMKAIRLRTEYLTNPMGIDIRRPRLSWNCEGGRRQTAYRIRAEKEGRLIWDSGKVCSDRMHLIPWEGDQLHSRDSVLWTMQLWDEEDRAGEISEEAFFEIGLGSATCWKAKWITGNYKVNKKERYPVDCFRKEFTCRRAVKKARLYITACGLYEARIDGVKVGDFYMAPGYTDYRKRVQYQTYDVTDMLSVDSHILDVDLADGWYRGSCGAYGLKNQYGSETKLLAQMEICYEDGSSDVIGTDAGWKWSDQGPVRFADNKDGEIVDARMDAFADSSYVGYAKLTSHEVLPTCSNNVPVTKHETFHPLITTAPNGKKLLDFGQNLAGIISFRVHAENGQRMVWRFGEMLDEEGNLTLANIQLTRKKRTTPLQKIEFTCKNGWNEYESRFTVFGFRYAEVEGDVELDPENIVSIAVYSDMKTVGSFKCSDLLLNRFYQDTMWSAKSNHLDIPTDCPTRERHGWTGDAQIFFETAAYMMDFASFSKKWLHDVFDWQKKDGCLPHIVPDGGADFYMRSMNGSVGWADVGILMPYRYAKMFGDKSILEEFYDGMARYARFMEKRMGVNHSPLAEKIRLSPENRKYLVNKGQSYGEWAEPEDVCAFRWQDFAVPHPEVSTAYTAYVLRLMANIARILGHDRDAGEFMRSSNGCRRAYQELVSGGKYSLDTDRQAQLIRPLAFNLLNEEQTEFAKKRLIKALDHYDWRLGTGFLSTPLILDVLTEIDVKYAYRLLENEDIPGWLSMPKNGATTIWEAWEGPASKQGGIGSLNHYSKGAVCAWLFRTMCGISVNGRNSFRIAPKPGGRCSFAESSYDSVYGLVSCRWEKDAEGNYHYTIQVPANTTATVELPGREAFIAEAGCWQY